MRVSFSTLACPDWTMPQIIAIAAGGGYDGIELRFVQGEDSLWKLPVFSGKELASTKRALADRGLTISCLDTSCRFHSPDATERGRLDHRRNSGWRIWPRNWARRACESFGDTIQPGADRASTHSWIAESIRELAEITAARGVEVWLENHGDFAAARSGRGNPSAGGLSRSAGWFGTRRTVSQPPRNSLRTVLSDWEGRFAMFTSRICSAIKTGGNMSRPARGFSPCLN